MNNNEFQTIGLYDHNADSYKKIKSAFETGKDIVGIVHATGTGKSYNALQLAYDNKDKKIVYVVPSNGIIEYIKKIIEDNPNLDLKRDFSNLKFRTYHSFVSLDNEEIENIDCDLLILDEFHHIGAPIWGARIDTMIETHPKMKIFGMTAYTVRDRGTSYERDMANPDTDELFSGKIESRYDLCDAMVDGVLPKPVYKSAYTNLIGLESKLEERVQRLDASTKEYQEYMTILSDVKRRIHEAPSIPDILRKSIKPNGKYIYFCPPCSEEGTNDIETVKKQAIEWFKQFVPEEDIIFYTTTSDMGDDGKKNRDAFYNDVTLEGEQASNKLRVMFAINQYNEGIHAPNIDGVIMGRGTTSDIVYFEQLGRALAVRGNTKDMFDELEKHSIEELIEMCKSRDIPVKENISKEELIEKLIAPVVIDLTNNYDFIKELENNLRDRIKDIQSNGLGIHRNIKIRDASLDIEIENQNLFEMLKNFNDRLTMTWEDYYELAKTYYRYHGDLEVPNSFKTIDGYTYDENGIINLGHWIFSQRRLTVPESYRGQLLTKIGMRFENKINRIPWEEMYEYAKKYYEHHKNLEIPDGFKTTDGYTYDENGTIKLGKWITNQRQAFKGKGNRTINQYQIDLLNKIGMRFMNKKTSPVKNTGEKSLYWNEMYECAQKYYEHYGNLEIPVRFKTNNGIDYDENGLIHLGEWIKRQRENVDPTSQYGELLTKIGLRFENIRNRISWEEMYEYAKKYYEYHGNLEVKSNFKTSNGYEYDEAGTINLGYWISNQRRNPNLNNNRKELLVQIGMIFRDEKQNDIEEIKPLQIDNISKRLFTWEEMYGYAKKYYEHYGNLEVPSAFKTNNGIDYDEHGEINLGRWIRTQRGAHQGTNNCKIEPEQIDLLNKIGMRFENVKSSLSWEEMYGYAKKYYEHYGNLKVSRSFKTNNGIDYDENGTINLGNWISDQRKAHNGTGKSKIDEKQITALNYIGMIWNLKLHKEQVIDICICNGIDQNINKVILNHITIQELQSKIEFLKEHNIRVIDENGLLIDIFSMSNSDMKEKYGISLEKIISEYYIKNQMGKGV